MIITHSIKAPVSSVFPFFQDLKKFGEVHPVIYQVDQINESDFIFFEQINMIFLYRFSYPVKIEKIIPNQQIILSSDVQMGVFLYLTYNFESKDNTTFITELVEIKANLIVKEIFKIVLKSSHLKMVKEIKKRLE